MDEVAPASAPPRVYRSMKRDADGLPAVGSASSSELGVRPGVDVTVDDQGDVVLDGGGMSVAPAWRQLDYTRISRRLRHLVPGASGPNSLFCDVLGVGPFERGPVADGLELVPDPGQQPRHGVLAPTPAVPLAQYLADLANTRAAWQIDEA